MSGGTQGGGTCTSTTTQLTVRRSTGRWNSQSVRMRRSSASCTARVPGSPCNPPPPPRQSREGSCLPSQVACSYRQSPSQLSHCRSVVARRFYALPPRTRCDQVSLLAWSGDASRIFTRPPSVLGSVFSSAGADNVYYIMGRCLWRHPVCMGGGDQSSSVLVVLTSVATVAWKCHGGSLIDSPMAMYTSIPCLVPGPMAVQRIRTA